MLPVQPGLGRSAAHACMLSGADGVKGRRTIKASDGLHHQRRIRSLPVKVACLLTPNTVAGGSARTRDAGCCLGLSHLLALLAHDGEAVWAA